MGKNRTNEERKDKIDQLVAQANGKQEEDPKEGIQLMQRALDLARGKNAEEPILPEKLAEAQYLLGVLQGAAFERGEALAALFEAFSIYSQLENFARQADVLKAISRVYWKCHDQEQALDYASRALRSYETLRDHENEALQLLEIGKMYAHSGFLTVAMNNLNKASSVAREIENVKIEAHALEKMAGISLQQNEYHPALGHALKNFQLQKKNGDKGGQAKILQIMGIVHSRLGNKEEAWDCLQQSLNLARTIQDSFLEANALLEMGQYQVEQQAFKDAVTQFEKALDISHSSSDSALTARCHLLLSQALEAAEQYKRAIIHLRRYQTMAREQMEKAFDSRYKGIVIAHRMETARKEAEIYELRNVALRHEIEQKEQMQARLEQTTIVDALTRCYNRRHWMELAQRELERAVRYQQPLSAMILDVEQLRNINLDHGQETGDRVLQHVASQCQKNLRKPDILARFGEDEFIILLPQTQHSGAKLLAERLRTEIETQPFSPDNQDVPVKISLGTTGIDPGKKLNVESLIDRTVHALYQQKTARRNPIDS